MLTSEPNVATVCCAICGGEIKLQLHDMHAPESAYDSMLLRAYRGRVVHDHCESESAQRANYRDAAVLAEMRSQSWGGVCPPEIQDTDEERIQKQIPPAAWRAVMDWDADAGKGLYVHGESGACKTRSVFTMLLPWHMSGKAIFAAAHDRWTGELYKLQSESEGLAARWLILQERVDIWFIDDLGKGKFARGDGLASMAEERLFQVLNRRTETKKPCLFTSEVAPEVLKIRFSAERKESMTRRIIEFCDVIAY